MKFTHFAFFVTALAASLVTAKPQLGDLLKSAGGAVSSAVGSVTSLWDDCQKGKEVFKTDPSVAAVMFTDEGCENTDIQLREGFTDLPVTKKNRAEAIMVKEGCICVAFDHADKEGKSAVFDNVGGNKILVVSELKDDQLGKDISAVDCKCGAAAKKGLHVDPMTKAEDCGSNCLKQCNKFVGQFNRVDLGAGKDVCAVLFDEDECQGWNKPVTTGFESFSILSKYRNDAESVMVKPGCTFTGYDNTDKSGNRVIVDAKAKANGNQPIYKKFRDSKVRTILAEKLA